LLLLLIIRHQEIKIFPLKITSVFLENPKFLALLGILRHSESTYSSLGKSILASEVFSIHAHCGNSE
jgi:hypothetical protein